MEVYFIISGIAILFTHTLLFNFFPMCDHYIQTFFCYLYHVQKCVTESRYNLWTRGNCLLQYIETGGCCLTSGILILNLYYTEPFIYSIPFILILFIDFK